MSRTAWLALLLAASHLLTAIVTCPTSRRTPLDAAAAAPVGSVSHSLPGQGGDEMHAHHHGEGHAAEDEVPPCHAPSSALKAPCPCGCDGSAPVARAGFFGLGEMILVEESEPWNEGLPLRGGARTPSLSGASPSPIDHVPIFA
jgi:hypothetical protein